MFSDGEISTVGAFNIEGYVGYKDDANMVCDFAPVILVRRRGMYIVMQLASSGSTKVKEV